MGAAKQIEGLEAAGRYGFSLQEASQRTGLEPSSTKVLLWRMKKRGDLAMPVKGFYTLVPPIYRPHGALPPEAFIEPLMQHLGQAYYVGLLSAALYHGAAHQRPQVFQVITPKARRPLVCGPHRTEFIAHKAMSHMPWERFADPKWGFMRLASPETTALELVGYAPLCGGLDHVATVLQELAPTLRPRPLLGAAAHCPLPWTQRLTYLLGLTQHHHIAHPLERWLESQNPSWTPLQPRSPTQDAARHKALKLLINTPVEPDL